MFSRNAQSSRAVPVGSTISANKIHVKPYVWGKNKAGMSSTEVLTPFRKNLAALMWNTTAKLCFGSSWLLSNIGLHKQWANRMTEWCSNIKVIITATEWENFFWLRIDEDAAQPEMVELAKLIKFVMDYSVPEKLEVGQWHLPYIQIRRMDGKWFNDVYYDSDGQQISLQTAQQISASCCAQISYRKLNESNEKALEIYGRLFNGAKPHESPVEHQGTPVGGTLIGETHFDTQGNIWSGNFKGWIQLRQIMKQDK
jgi:hypothetical protein